MKNIYKALANFQQSVPVIHKDTEGYGYSYADLPAIFEVINPLLKENGLGFTQPINGTQIKTILFHIESGETIESETDIPQGVALAKMNDFQVLGSAITYLRRYAISSMLGLVTDKDIDAAGETKPKTPNPKTTETSSDLPWLNSTLADKKTPTKEWAGILKRIETGTKIPTMTDLKKVYKISKDTIQELNDLNIF